MTKLVVVVVVVVVVVTTMVVGWLVAWGTGKEKNYISQLPINRPMAALLVGSKE